MIIDTPRLRLRRWSDADRFVFAALNSDTEVMADLGGPINRAESDTKLARYKAAFDRHGFCRWAIGERQGGFVGYAGVMPSPADHPLGPHVEIGWRLVRSAWGQGYASEAARAALDDAFDRVRLNEIFAYAAADNLRSQRVMQRLGMRRDPDCDFEVKHDKFGAWRGLVWVARRGEWVADAAADRGA